MTSIGNTAPDVGDSAPKTYPKTIEGPETLARRSSPVRAERQLRFGDLLGLPGQAASRGRGKTPGEHEDEVADGGVVSNPAALGQWFRTEIPAEMIGPAPVRPVVRLAPHHRLLVSTDAEGNGLNARARIEISAGKLAGCQIQLVAIGGRIEAHLLTGNQASRQTLTAAMDAVREKLRTRGLALGGAWTAPDSARTAFASQSLQTELSSEHPVADRSRSR